MAPTAPHATPPDAPRASGPTRFWDPKRVRIAFGLTLAFSLVAHGVMSPWRLLPDTSGVEFKDVADELTIPVDLVSEPAPEPPKVDPPTTPSGPGEGPGAKRDAGANPRDASVPRDAEASDASPRAKDGGSSSEGLDGGSGEAGTALTDAGTGPVGANGPSDPGAMIGMPGILSAGKVNVTLLVNMNVIKVHPVGKRLGPLLYGIKQWAEFMNGTEGVVDPVKDTDWVLVYGPSLIHTERDAVLVHYSAPDQVVDRAIDIAANNYAQGGPFDAGVPGVKARLAHADNAERVFLRAQPHVLAVVPPDKAYDFARVLKKAPVQPKVRPGEAMRLTVKDPYRQISIKDLKFPTSLSEIRLWIIPNKDGSAMVYGEGDCTDEAGAEDVSKVVTTTINRINNPLVQLATRGMLNEVKVDVHGTHVELSMPATVDQIEMLLQLIAAKLGVEIPPLPTKEAPTK